MIANVDHSPSIYQFSNQTVYRLFDVELTYRLICERVPGTRYIISLLIHNYNNIVTDKLKHGTYLINYPLEVSEICT